MDFGLWAQSANPFSAAMTCSVHCEAIAEGEAVAIFDSRRVQALGNIDAALSVRLPTQIPNSKVQILRGYRLFLALRARQVLLPRHQ